MQRALIVMCVALAGCTASPSGPIGPQGYTHEGGHEVALSAAEQENARRIVLATLRDPESAKFGPRIVGGLAPDGFRIICGTVNTKNDGMRVFRIMNWGSEFHDRVIIDEDGGAACARAGAML